MNSSTSWVVSKFGGTSVSSLESIQNIVKLTQQYRTQGKRVLLVVSALSGVSNRLEAICQKTEVVDVESVVNVLRKQHIEFMDSLQCRTEFLESLLDETLAELTQESARLLDDQLTSYFATQAKIMSIGEQLSSAILRQYLENQLNEAVVCTDSREWLVSEPSEHRSKADRYLNAECDVQFDKEKTEQLSALGNVLITQGFVVANKCGETVVLGRGGSDTSAAYFSVLLNAKRLEIWTDVPGMFSANPRLIPESRQLLQLDYREAQEIASTGAKVLHPRCIRPARNAQIPIFVGSTFAPEKGGTLIGSFPQAEPQVKAISVRAGVLLIAMETSEMWQTPGFLAEAFNVFYKHGLSVDQISTSETNVTVTLDNLTQGISSDRIRLLAKELEHLCRVTILENCAAVSIVGRSIRMLLAQLSHAFEAFQNRSVHMLTQAANNLNFTFVLDANEAPQLVKQLHERLVTQHEASDQIGRSWQEIFELSEAPESGFTNDTWWHKSAKDLERIAQEQGATYVYSVAQVQKQIDQLRSMRSIDRVFYAIKANPHPELLQQVEKAGLGFECVSIQEVQHVLELFPNIDNQRILFTPNFALRQEYEQALEIGIHLTLDNLYPLQHWGEIFRGRSLFLRVDTGTGKGHHQHVKTAGKEAKFGIPIDALHEHRSLIDELDVSIVGLHCHVGSGILTPENWVENGEQLAQLLQDFPNVKTLDLGGGLGIVEKPKQAALALEDVDKLLSEFKRSHPSIELWLEPGRYIVAESGVLLARVTQLKGKAGAGYLGIETGMNSLIRPALYGAYHRIVNLSRLEEPASEMMTIVGPICETGDKLGIDRMLPVSYEGDVILIANTGAYGRVMSSRYNLREPAKEVIFEQTGH